MIGQTISHYRVLSLLGEGGMGAVYVAEDTRLGRKVAVKIPHTAPAADNSFHARFLREARSISHLSHPNIATVYDFGETDTGRPFIVMELVEGRELGDLLREGGMTLRRAVDIVREVAEALSEAHQRGVIHRDIKPSNVVVNSRGTVKVLDFGLAKLVTERQHTGMTSADETLMKFRTRSDLLVGTPLYLSPEQAKGVEVDPRSDLFALGALLYECITGQPAFSGATVMEIAAQVIHVNPPAPSSVNPDVPVELDRLTLRALAKKPEDRYQSAGEMIEDLRLVGALLAGNNGTHVTAAPNSPAARTVVMAPRPTNEARTSMIMTLSENLRRPRLSVASVLGMFAAAAVVAVIWMWAQGRTHQPLPEAERLAETGADFLREGAYWHAGKTLQRAVELDDNYALAHARRAEALMEQDYADRANESLLRVRQLVPNSSALPDRERLYLDAVYATATRKFSDAVSAYAEIARRWPSPSADVDLGRAYERRSDAGDLDLAERSYLEATKRDANYATAYLRVGNLYARRQEYDAALETYGRAEAIYKESGMTAEGRAEVLYQRGSMLRSRGLLFEARSQLQEALKIASTNGYDARQVAALLQLSAVEYAENNTEAAANHAREAIELAEKAGLENLVALGLVDLGNVFFAAGKYEEAEKHMRQGLGYAERNRAGRVRAKALGNLGSVIIQRGATDEGVPLVQQALAFYQAGGYRSEAALTHALLGRAARSKGNYKEALDSFNHQLQLAEQVGEPSQAALAHTEIGNVLLRQDDPLGALKHFDDSCRIEQALGRGSRIGYCPLLRADALWPVGRIDEARAALDEAAKIAQSARNDNKDLLAGIYLTGADVALSQNRPDEAKRLAQQALPIISQKNTRRIAKAKLTLAVAQVRAGGGVVAAGRAADDALAAAKDTGDPSLVSAAQLTLAEALLRAGDAQGAVANALQAREFFVRAGQHESEWRALLVAAAASRVARDENAARRYAESAAGALRSLEQRWGPEAAASYQSRADVKAWRQQLNEFLAAPRPA